MISFISGHRSTIIGLCALLGFCFSAAAQQTPVAPAPVPAVQQPTQPNTEPNGQSQTPSDRSKEGKNANPPAPSTAGAPVDSNAYKIGPADVLNIRVWNEPEFSGPVAVHQDGKITLPLVGDLQAGDQTPVQVEHTITTALSKYIVKPLVTVIVQEVGSKKYYMDGHVNRPGEYPLVVPTTVLEAISKAGGLQEFANEKHVYVLRGDQRIPFNYKDVLRGKHMDQNIELKPGDHVVVP
ncbi:MAG TPA: polysaccharide biosynthesis/export family protein [Bryobacteraceae bacterium]|nr:polysaccharide biosynthesis/export family protein [Bryobacteraceae bacterium]